MINEYLTTTGSIFLSGAFVSLLSPTMFEEELSQEELEKKVSLAIELVKTSKIINAPIIMNKLNCDAKTANKIINILVERGIIVLSKE